MAELGRLVTPRGLTTKVSFSVSIPADLAAWIVEEGERRFCHRNVIVIAGIRLLREALEVAPDLVALPGGLRPTSDPDGVTIESLADPRPKDHLNVSSD